jgi:hypothetical protein
VQNFPRLTALFGTRVAALDAAAIQTAIQNRTPEGPDLDWKGAHYPKDKNFDIAKDVARLANAAGGIIVLGVAEDNGCAAAPNPVTLGDDQQSRIRQVLAGKLQPFLPGVELLSIETGQGVGFLVIVVPRSADAPHAVVDDNGLRYPVPDGTTTRWLTEYEVALRYRDRFQSQATAEALLNEVHTDGISRIALWQGPWLSLSLVPLISGSRGIGSQALAAEREFLTAWKTRYAGRALEFPFRSDTKVVPGIRRAILTETHLYAGRSAHPHAELLYSGAGFAATPRIFQPGEQDSAKLKLDQVPGADQIYQDAVEVQLMILVWLLAQHAVDAGASGECYLRAQQLLRQQTGPDQAITAAQIFAPVSWAGRFQLTEYDPVDFSLALSTQGRPAYGSASLDELVADLRSVVRTGYALAADVLGEFGVSEPIILRPDGSLNVDRLHWHRKPPLESWAQANGLVATPGI